MELVNAGGISVPRVGFGTWRLYGEDCALGVADAIQAGYRYIDTAARYENEEAVGRGMRRGGVPREELLLCTKLQRDLAPSEVRNATLESLSRLGTDYADLLLMHWPNTSTAQNPTIEAMVHLVDEGLVRAIGVSNFTAELLREVSDYPLAMNQVEYHPYLAQPDLLALADEYNQVFGAYAPLARGRVSEDPRIARIASEHSRTPAQIALRWLIQQPRVIAIPKAGSAARRRENIEIFDFSLTDEEMLEIGGRERGERLVDPPFAPAWDVQR